ncbi:MAG: beta-propeller domain-containing protein [Deltaproteobacteria bacterium]
MKHCPISTPFRARASVLGAASLLLLAACESGTEARDPLDGLAPAGQLKLQLTRSDSCEELLVRIQTGLVVPLAERAKQLKDPANAGGRDGSYPLGGPTSGPGGGFATPGQTAEGTGNSGAPPPSTQLPVSDGAIAAPAPTNPTKSADDSVSSDPAVRPSPAEQGGGFSGTTVQIKDVDEADIVKADGDRIYLLHGGTLFVLQGWPASSTSILGSTLVEGEPTEMFVRDGKAVVFSRVYLDPTALPGAKLSQPGYYYGYGSTKLTVLDVSGTNPSVLRESYLEGDYVSARRHDGLVRAVVQNGFKVPQIGNPSIEYVDAFGHAYPQEDIDAQVDDWLERTARSIQNSEITDWLPREYSKVGGRILDEQPRCKDYYSADPGLTESGVTSIVALDLDNVSAPFSGATILGRAERVYSNEAAVLVTQTDYRYELVKGSTQQTLIHRFDIDGAATSYVASGAIEGTIHDQFSLDERDGVIRVATTEQNFAAFQGGGMAVPTPTPLQPVDAIAPVRPANGLVNRVVTLGTDGDQLVQLGSTADFGTSESIYSTRFIGDLGYVVTFRQTDPLFVIDLSDPKLPHVVGELKVPGYSSYLFPMDDDHLFAIGQDATPQGTVTGLSLSIFDVSNPASPALAQRYTFPESGASPANVDHRAINFHKNGNVVAFPYQRYDTGASTLEVFQLSAASGFTRLGGMAETLDFERCASEYYGYPPELAESIAAQNGSEWRAQVLANCGWSKQFRRGLFRDDFVYGISNTGVYAYNLGAMAAGAVGQLSLPREVYSNAQSGSMGGGSTGIGMAAPTTTAAPPKPAEAPPQMADGAK